MSTFIPTPPITADTVRIELDAPRGQRLERLQHMLASEGYVLRLRPNGHLRAYVPNPANCYPETTR